MLLGSPNAERECDGSLKAAGECAARGLIGGTKVTLVVNLCDLCIYHGTMTTRLELEEPIRLEFSNNSVRRTTAQVDSLGIFYSVSREDDGIINIRRWDQPTNTEILVGQINFKVFVPSLVRFGEGEQWGNIRDFLRREHGRFYSPFVSSLLIT